MAIEFFNFYKNYQRNYKMAFEDFDNLPIDWADHEDIAMKLYERFGDDFTESKIYRVRFTELFDWITEIPNFVGDKEGNKEGHLEQIQAKWVYEWRDNQ
jgi:FeS assembly protein IscX